MSPFLILSGLSAASSGLGSYFGARSERNNLRHQAAMDRINAQVTELQARDAMLQGQRREQSSRLKTAALKSSQRVALAANGVDLGEGSAANILTSTDYLGEMDANAIAADAIKSAWGYKVESTNLRNRAAMSDANAFGVSPGAAAGTSLLGSATSVAGHYYAKNKGG